MEKVREYRKRAAICRDWAARAPTAANREYYLDLAQMWENLAQERMTFFIPKEADKAG